MCFNRSSQCGWERSGKVKNKLSCHLFLLNHLQRISAFCESMCLPFATDRIINIGKLNCFTENCLATTQIFCTVSCLDIFAFLLCLGRRCYTMRIYSVLSIKLKSFYKGSNQRLLKWELHKKCESSAIDII